MEQTIIDFLKNSPPLAVLVGVVWMFLRDRGAVQASQENLQNRCHDVQRESMAVVAENTKAVAELHEAIGELRVTLRSINGK